VADRPTQRQRRAVAKRAGGSCEYCRAADAFTPDVFETEHILPRSRGGQTELDNLAWASGGCNLYKSNRVAYPDPVDGKDSRLFNPREDEWSDHFEWGLDLATMVGKTAIGRATIAASRTNRPSLVNFRRALLAIAQHPPG
jgi:hypothetical protein